MSLGVSTIHLIAQNIFCKIEKGKILAVQDLGLFSGSSGVLLFMSNYLHFYPNSDYQHKYGDYLETYIYELSNTPLTNAFGNGLSGILSCLKFLNKASLANIDYSSIEATFLDSFLESCERDIINNNYDLMYGGLGFALYYSENEKFVKGVIDVLSKTAIVIENNIKWLSYISSTRSMGFNISLSHGMSSLVIYLSIVLNKFPHNTNVKTLLLGVTSFIISQEIDYYKYGCCFPSVSLECDRVILKSSLAWCYGDLGVAIALWQAGSALNDTKMIDKALNILKKCALRKSEVLNEPGICHGSAGVALMFYYMFKKTNIGLFYEAAKYWQSITLKFVDTSKEFCGFKQNSYIDFNQKWEFRNDYELLEGISGIGLVLLSLNLPPLDVDWYTLLLLY